MILRPDCTYLKRDIQAKALNPGTGTPAGVCCGARAGGCGEKRRYTRARPWQKGRPSSLGRFAAVKSGMWSLLSWEAQHGDLQRPEGGGLSTVLKEKRRLGVSEGGEEEMRLRIIRRRLRQAGQSMGNEGGRGVKRDSASELT